MVIACKSCKKVFRRPPIAEWEDADEYCPHCDAHILVEPELAKGAESGRRMAAWHSRSPCPCLCQWTMAATLDEHKAARHDAQQRVVDDARYETVR